MNKIFHARISWYHYVSLILATGTTIWGFWDKNIFMGILFMFYLIIIIEKIIHTSYTVTIDGELIVYNGRFSKKVKVKIGDINSIERCHTMNFRNFHFAEFVLIRYKDEKYISLEPIKEQEFVNLINKIRADEKRV